MTRSDVFAAISGERKYQGQQWPEGDNKSVGDFLTLLDVYVSNAQRKWANCAGDTQALHEIRKIAAIAVHAMEVHGAPRRSATRAGGSEPEPESKPESKADRISREHQAFIDLLERVHRDQSRQVMYRGGSEAAVAIVTMRDFDVLQAIDDARNEVHGEATGNCEATADPEEDGTECVPHDEFEDRY